MKTLKSRFTSLWLCLARQQRISCWGTIAVSFRRCDWLFPPSAREVPPGNRSNHKSTRERVDSKGLYGRWRLHLMGSWWVWIIMYATNCIILMDFSFCLLYRQVHCAITLWKITVDINYGYKLRLRIILLTSITNYLRRWMHTCQTSSEPLHYRPCHGFRRHLDE